MLPNVKTLFTRLRTLHAQAYSELQALGEKAKTITDMKEHADLAMAYHEMYKFADDIRKQIDNNKDLSERMACLLWVNMGEAAPENIKTPYTTATPKVKMMASIPKKRNDPELYGDLMEYLGIGRELWDREEEVVRPHWPGFVDFLTTLQEEGRPLPPGIDPSKMYPVYSLLLRRKKGIDE